MHRTRSLIFLLLCLCCAFAAGCRAGKAPGKTDLAHRRFVLENVDGKTFSSMAETPDIEFGEGFRVYGKICNRFTGQGELEGNVLFVRLMASTKMICADADLNRLENQFAQMLMAGVVLELSGNTLALRQVDHELVYTLQDRVQ